MQHLPLWCFVLLALVAVKTNCADHSIETRVFVDRRAVESWKSKIAADVPEAQKDAVTKSAMEKYIKAAFNDMNSIFAGLSAAGINLDARIVGNIEFVTEQIFTGNSNVKNANAVLDEFEKWVSAQNLPRVDHTMLFTGLDMKLDGSEGNMGIANLGQMCDVKGSLSAMEAVPSGSVTATMTHELGHSLGAEHDGFRNRCRGTHFVMKANEDAEMATKDNFKFSSCSINYFKRFLASRKADCLKQTTIAKQTSAPLGTLYTPDQICQMVQGNGSQLCRGFYGPGEDPYSNICLSLMCQEPGKDTCLYIVGADGLVCGEGKRCSLGHCVADTSLSTGPATDTCPLGDNRLPLGDLQGKTCSQGVADDPTYCEDDFIRRSCCQSCQGVSVSPDYDVACTDKERWCPWLKSFQCYDNDDICCATCKKFETDLGDENCLYGDKARWCRRIGNRGCRRQYNRRICCQTCASVQNSNWYNNQGSGSGSWNSQYD